MCVCVCVCVNNERMTHRHVSLMTTTMTTMMMMRVLFPATEEAREHLTERERHLAAVKSEQNKRVMDAAERKRANHAEWLRQEANRRNKSAKHEEQQRMSWYHQAERVRQFEIAKMDLESGDGDGDVGPSGGGGGGFIKKTLLPVAWLWETWGGKVVPYIYFPPPSF